MPDTTRSAADILRDLNTIRQGKMPTGDKAPSRARRDAPDLDTPIVARDPRDKRPKPDVNLPVDPKLALYRKLTP
jgi:hypothetical protein